jgi:hypothetical protein
MSGSVDAGALAGEWIHAHEEDNDRDMVFRRPTHRFPPSRGRRAFHLRPDGSMSDRRPGADDRPETTDGSWSLSDDGQLALTPANPARAASRLLVRSVAPDRLVIAR